MAIKLSHSSLSLFTGCGMAYRLQYIDKIRAVEQSANLTFGKSVDSAFTAMLVGLGVPEQVFLDEWTFTEDNQNVTYSKSDLDMDLISAEDAALYKDNVKKLSSLSLRAKGLLMVKALRDKILPNIKKLHSTQEQVVLGNQDESGDTFIGFIDLVAEYVGYDKPIIFDLKTSSVKYKPESVKESQQLCIYSYAAGSKYSTKLAGYIVLDKKIKKTRTKVCKSCNHTVINNTSKTCINTVTGKRCGGDWTTTTEFDVNVDVIVDEIAPHTEEAVLNLMDKSHEEIKSGVFVQNWDSCYNKTYHKQCAYYEYCRSGSMEGLICKKEEVK